MSGNVTLVSTDPQEVIERVLQIKETEGTSGEVAPKSDESVVESPATSTESNTEQTDEHDEDEASEAGQKLSKRSQKIKRLAGKLTEAERERDEWRQKFEESSRGRVEAQPGKKEATEDPYAYPVAKPKSADFANPQDFVEALTEWKVDEREYRGALKAQAEEAQAERKEVYDAYNLRVAEAKGDYEDFEQVVTKSDLKIWPAVQEALLVHEKGPDLVYHLANNPEVAEKLLEMTPARAVMELGKLATTLDVQESSPPEHKKPRLINPVGGGSKQPDVPSNRDNLPFAEWKKLRKAGKIR